jgi:hypothetical protein
MKPWSGSNWLNPYLKPVIMSLLTSRSGAIGTGKTATAADVKAMHGFIRTKLAESVDHADKVAILYGGSVKAANAAEILSTKDVDGVLVGGASLQLEEFRAIAQAAPTLKDEDNGTGYFGCSYFPGAGDYCHGIDPAA